MSSLSSPPLQADRPRGTVERPTTSTNVWVGVAGAVVLVTASVLLFITVISRAGEDFTTGAALGMLASVLLLLLGIGGAAGLVVNAPNEARVLTFLGRYAGTLTSPGFSWVNPFTIRRRVSQRIRTLDSDVLKEMLRRQHASAVVAARQLIVEGPVGMVEHALEMLNERGVVELDEDRKAAMVSNLLVVLCSDRGAQPVVNSGSLYR